MNDIVTALIAVLGTITVAMINQGRIAKRSAKRVEESDSTMDEMLERLKDLRADKRDLQQDKRELQEEIRSLRRTLEQGAKP